METERFIGEILHYNKQRAFGFICGLSDRTSYFFHVSHIAIVNGTRAIPSAGDLYTFAIRESARTPGKLDAVDLQLSKRATATPTTAAMSAAVSGVAEVKS